MTTTSTNTQFFKWMQLKGGEESWLLFLADHEEQVIKDRAPAFTTILAADNDFTVGSMTAEDMAKVHYRGPWYLDFDAPSIGEALPQYQKFLIKLRDEHGFDLNQASLYASGGKGFHITIPAECFIPKVKATGVVGLPAIFKEMANDTFVDCLDMRVFTARRGRMFRTSNVERPDKTGVYKVPLSVEESFNLTPETYKVLCSAPRYLPPPAPATFNSSLGRLYSSAYTKVEKALKNRRKGKADAKLIQKFGEGIPPSIEMIMRGEGLLEGVGFQKIAIQLALTAHALAQTEEQFVSGCAGLLENHISDGNRYNTPGKRKVELARMFHYMAQNPCYEFSIGGIKSLMVKGTKTPDLDEGQAKLEEADTIAEFNETHAVVIAGGSVAMMREGLSEFGGTAVNYMTKDGLATYYQNRFIFVEKLSPDGETVLKKVPFIGAWLASPDRRTHEGLTFAPGGNAPEGFYNLWRGFAVEPSPLGVVAAAFKCKRFLHHLKFNVCSGNKVYFRYLMAWLADMVQDPERKKGVALVVRGRKGTGKSKFADVLRRLLGGHSFKASKSEQIVGRFSAHLADKLLLVCEESFFAGGHADHGTLKDLITSDTITIEPKFIGAFEVKSCHRVMMITNSDWAIPATADERRFFVLDCGEGQMQNPDYFAGIDAQMFHGDGLQAFLALLQQFDLIGVNLRKVPQTDALATQKQLSLEVHDQFVLDSLVDGELAGVVWSAGENGPLKADVYDAYQIRCRSSHVRPMASNRFGPHLQKLTGVWHFQEGGGERRRRYHLPSLKVARQKFNETVQYQFEPDDE